MVQIVWSCVTSGIAVGSSEIQRFERRLLSRTSDAVSYVKAARLPLQVPHLTEAPSPSSLASGAGRRFTGERRVVAVPSARLPRARTKGATGLPDPSFPVKAPQAQRASRGPA